MAGADAGRPELRRQGTAKRAPLVVFLRVLLAIGFVGVAYFAVSRVSLLLAIPPGYATAVWPAAGIALAAVILGGYWMLLGVWLGSFASNLVIAVGDVFVAEVDAGQLLVPGAIGAGAALQAAAGAAIVARFSRYRNIFEQDSVVLPILLLGGPVACLVSASIGVVVLLSDGTIAPSTAPLSWWTWWAGDTIGVLVFTPLVLVWAARPLGKWLRQQLVITIPLVLLFAAVVTAFITISKREQVRIDEGLARATDESGRSLQEKINSTMSGLISLEGLYASNTDVKSYEFEIFARRVLTYLPTVQALAWVPQVAAADRPRVEREARRDGLDAFQVRELGPGGSLVPAAKRDRYFPVRFVTPMSRARGLLGFDMGSEAVRRDALEGAMNGGRPVVSGGVPLVQAGSEVSGVLVVMPVYRHGIQPVTVTSRQRYLHGFTIAVLRLPDLLELGLEKSRDADLRLELWDDAATVSSPLLLASGPQASPGDLHHSVPVTIGDQQWRLQLRLPEAELASRSGWQMWTVLAGGVLLTGLLGILLLVTTSRTAKVEALVEQRTAELSRLNESLQESERDQRRTARKLAESNRELEQFAYVASHDLKAPLRTVSSFAQLLQQRHTKSLDGDALEFLNYIGDGIQQMQGLIDGLLELSRVDRKHLQREVLALPSVMEDVRTQLKADLESTRARLVVGELPEVTGDRRMLAQLLQNLVANGLKFCKPDVPPEIRVTSTREGEDWELQVRDNGIGMKEQHLDQIFMMFKRLHTVDQIPGSGIGLALCRRIVNLHGGDIWATSAEGEGTVMHVRLPVEARALPEEDQPAA